MRSTLTSMRTNVPVASCWTSAAIVDLRRVGSAASREASELTCCAHESMPGFWSARIEVWQRRLKSANSSTSEPMPGIGTAASASSEAAVIGGSTSIACVCSSRCLSLARCASHRKNGRWHVWPALTIALSSALIASLRSRFVCALLSCRRAASSASILTMT